MKIYAVEAVYDYDMARYHGFYTSKEGAELAKEKFEEENEDILKWIKVTVEELEVFVS